MTFYNVLSALLFIGALRAWLISIESVVWQDVFALGCFAVIVFNDMLSFSLSVEIKKEIDYTAGLMLIDLANFLLLALALVIISPGKNLFDVPLPTIARQLGSSAFWLFLLLYWLLLMLWTYLGRRSQRRAVIGQITVAVVFLVRWLLSLWTATDRPVLFNAIVFAYVLLYLTVVRPILRRNSQRAIAN